MANSHIKWQSYISGRWRQHVIPAMIWLGAAGCVACLIGHHSQQLELRGIVHGEQCEIAALTEGRLAQIPVQLFEHVEKGQVLAILEDDSTRAALTTAAAESTRLQAELAAANARLTNELASHHQHYTAEARHFAIDVEQTRLKALETIVEIETDKITLHRLKMELDRLRGLLGQEAALQYEIEIADTKHAAAAKEIKEREKTLAQLELDIEAASQRRDAFMAQSRPDAVVEEILSPLRAAVSVQESRVAELSHQRSSLVLYSPFDGVVGDVSRGVGETVHSGETIMIVVASQPNSVITHVSAIDANRIAPGSKSECQRMHTPSPTERFTAEVAAVGPAIVQIPPRLWRNPSVPEWGCPVRLLLPAGVRLRMEEMLTIHIPFQHK